MAADPYKYFRIEARELLEQLSQGALDLEKGSPPDDLLARLLRVAHTLKGAARVVKQPQIAEQAHQLEDLFTALRARSEQASRDEINRVLALIDAIGTHLAALPSPGEPQAQGPRRAAVQETVHVLRADHEDVEALVRGIAEAQSQLAVLRPQVDDLARIGHLIELIEDQLAGVGARLTTAPERQRIGKALSMVDEARGRLGVLQRHAVYGIDQVDREMRQAGDAAARLRLLPASGLLRFLERAARDAAQALGKHVRFEGRGGDIRLDSEIVTIIQSALLQLVRNAVAHGIESTGEQRRGAGKSAEGHVAVAVSRRGTSIAFVCSDDGGGIDFAALRRILQQHGARAADYQTLDDDALLRHLLKGGISTAGTVSDVAGRGIGLDVVREAAERLGGQVAVRSEPGKGTTVELVVPSSIASFRALLVEAAGVVAAIPLDAVRQTLRLTPDAIVDTAQGPSIVVNDKSVRLSSLDGIVHPASGRRSHPAAASAFVIEMDNRAAAFTVDRVLGTAHVVARPLPLLAPAAPAIAGASLAAGHEPRLVLDPASLIAEAERGRSADPEPAPVRHTILIVDDSLTTRMLEQSILESAGYEVNLATSGEEGLQKAREGRYALFLVDVEMPGMDGFTFIEHVRADPGLRDTPSILVTSRASAEDRQRGRDVGAQGYMVKSDFDQSALLEQIRTLVQ